MGFLGGLAGGIGGFLLGGPAGAAAGYGIGSSLGGGSGNTQTSSSTSAPWGPQQPYLTKGFDEASRLYDKGPANPYPYNTVASMGNPTIDTAWDKTYARATDGSPVVSAAKNTVTGFLNGNYSNPSTGYFNGVQNASYTDNPASGYFGGAQGGKYLNSNPVNRLLGGTASGAYLNSNPYLDATYNQAADSVVNNYQQATSPGTDSSFENAGRYGSGLLANAKQQDKNALGKNLQGLATSIYGNNYANERTNQINAAGTIGNAYAGERSLQQGAANDLSGVYQQQAARSDNAALANSNNYNTSREQQLRAATLAPGLANQDYVDLQQMQNVGTQQNARNQQDIDAAMKKYQFEQDAPYTALQKYQQGITGNYGSQGTSTTPITNNLAGTVGTLAGAYFGGNGGGNSFLSGGFGGQGGTGYIGSQPWMNPDVIASPWQNPGTYR